MTVKPKETDLAGQVSAWLRSDGWRTYHEVPVGSGRIDILAVRHGLVWAVETKLHLNIDVIMQALARRDGRQAAVHGALVATPRTKSPSSAVALCHHLHIGVILADKTSCEVKVWPEFRRQARVRGLLAGLSPEQEAQVAGASGGSYWTPFKRVARELVYAVAAAPGQQMTVAEAAAQAVVRQYKGDRAAPQLRRWLVVVIEHRWLPGLSLAGTGKRRSIVFDPAALTAAQIDDFHLDRHRLATIYVPPTVPA